ncbi:hypothetical protein LCGC14_3044360 [marine sediment metagenome]|uniref:Uncharacterized protein n=1 Tax=marine sediment metagenome TaxID=412755 RepID=A0A0F8ZEK4_9ZZZZ
MKIKKKKIWNLLKTLSRAGFIIFLFLAVFNLGILFGTYSEEGETVNEFFTKKTRYEWNSLESPPQIVTDQINDYNNISRLIWFSLFFSFAVMFFDYFVDPEHHFATKIKNKWGPKLKKIGKELEED